MQKSFRNNILLCGIFSAALIVICALQYQDSYSSNVWHLLACGREMVENGIIYQNPFAQQEGLSMIVQDWGLCAFLYMLYSIGGLDLLSWWTILLTMFLAFSLIWVGRLYKQDRFGLEIVFALALIALPAYLSKLNMCSAAYSMIAFCWVLFFCQKYRLSNRWQWLICLLPIAWLHAACSLSFAILDLLIVGCFAIPDFLSLLHRRQKCLSVGFADAAYKRTPLLLTLLCMALLLCLNPYGVKGALYLFYVLPIATYNGVVYEMNPLAPVLDGLGGISMVAMALMTLIAIGRLGARRIDLPTYLLFAATVVVSFLFTRDLWFSQLFAIAIISEAARGASWDLARLPWKWAHISSHIATIASIIMCSVAVAFGIIYLMASAGGLQASMKNDNRTADGIIKYLREDVDASGKDDSNINVFNVFEVGPYLEWNGIPVYLDSAIEAWNSDISGGDEDRFFEYADLLDTETTTEQIADFVRSHDFDYLITIKGTPMNKYLESDPDYTTLVGNNYLDLWKRK